MVGQPAPQARFRLYKPGGLLDITIITILALLLRYVCTVHWLDLVIGWNNEKHSLDYSEDGLPGFRITLHFPIHLPLLKYSLHDPTLRRPSRPKYHHLGPLHQDYVTEV